jgi:cation diffusion facilitator family transporter
MPPARRERGVVLVVALTAIMMLVEISVGYASGSMALLADGWHMATHVGALGLASAAYAFSRRYAEHRAFVFGTGKLRALAGYTSAVALGLVAAFMVVESVLRLVRPQAIDFASSLPVAALGLAVNVVSVLVLHVHDDEEHDEHDHNHNAAFLHVLADTFTSALAICALLVGRFLEWTWLDPVSGIVGGVVILKWGADLVRHAALELLDVAPSPALEDEIRGALEAVDDVRVRDLHVWAIGGPAKSCVVTLVSATPREPAAYRAALARFGLAHLTIEVERAQSL